MRHFGLTICLLGMGLGLSGCELVQSMGQSIQSFQWNSSQEQKAGAAASVAGTAGGAIMADLPSNCPELKVLGDLSSITQFAVPAAPKPEQMIATAKVSSVDATCSVAPNSVTLDITLDFDGALGPVGKQHGTDQANYTYPYFLSVVAPNGKILSKDVFALAMTYDGDVAHLHKQDRVRQTIPLGAGQKANQFQIIAGFQLSPDELKYNRQ